MMSNETIDPNSFSGLSLAELSGFDTSDMSALMSRLPTKGIFLCRGKADGKPVLSEQASNDPSKPNLIRFNWYFEIIEATPEDTSIDPDSLAGRSLTQTSPIWPDRAKEEIQLAMGMYKKAGLPHKGPMGGVEGHEPGWLDSYDGAFVKIRVRHGMTREGTERAYIDWVALTDEELADLGVERAEH